MGEEWQGVNTAYKVVHKNNYFPSQLQGSLAFEVSGIQSKWVTWIFQRGKEKKPLSLNTSRTIYTQQKKKCTADCKATYHWLWIGAKHKSGHPWKPRPFAHHPSQQLNKHLICLHLERENYARLTEMPTWKDVHSKSKEKSMRMN